MIDIQLLEEARKEGKTIGLVQGSWDLFHIGHLRYLLEARRQCGENGFLIVGMDSDEKIRKRKGKSRPIIPEYERKEFIELLGIAGAVVVKDVNEPKWGLIKTVRPDVLIAIQENYTDEEIVKLHEFCGKVAILPRQAEGSTSDIFRKIVLANQQVLVGDIDEKIILFIENFKQKIGFNEKMNEPIPMLIEYMKNSTDSVHPVASAIFWNGKWVFGTNQIDLKLPASDIKNRTELFYNSVEHSEMNLLKKLGDVEKLNTPIWVTLFPCDKCMKVLNDKGINTIYYLDDHPEKNWSKRSHELAEKWGIKTINLSNSVKDLSEQNSKNQVDSTKNKSYKFINPKSFRDPKQLEIMERLEEEGKDPLDPKHIDQEILFETDFWYVTKNRFPYENAQHHFLVVAKNPVYSIEDMSEEMQLDFCDIWKDLIQKYDILGGALGFRFGETSYSGASLKRLHAHLISPKTNCKIKFNVGTCEETER